MVDGRQQDDGSSKPQTETVTTESASAHAEACPRSPEHRAKKESGHSIKSQAKNSTSHDNDVSGILRQ